MTDYPLIRPLLPILGLLAAVGCAIVGVVITAPLGLRAEVIRGADLDEPGVVFRVYNRLATPQLAELIDLYVERDLPLVWYRPYRAYPNDLNALAESYRQDVQRIMAVEARR